MGAAVSGFQRQRAIFKGKHGQIDDDITAVEIQFDMWLISASDFLHLDALVPYQELQRQKKLVRWHPGMRTVFFVSHQWTAFGEPDPTGKQLSCFQQTLLRMLNGTMPSTRPTFADAHALPAGVAIEASEWQELVHHAHIWMDFLSFPQISCCSTAEEARAAEVDLVKAIRSIPGYIERCSHFFALCPSVQHRDLPALCNFGSWLDRGWCRVELIALLLARQRKPPAIVIKSTEGSPFMIAPMQAVIRPPGLGFFTCCARNHELTDADGQTRAIKCDKEAICNLLLTLLDKRMEYFFGRDEMLDFRLWQAAAPHFLRGTQVGLHAHHSFRSCAAFFDAYAFSAADAASAEASGSSGRPTPRERLQRRRRVGRRRPWRNVPTAEAEGRTSTSHPRDASQEESDASPEMTSSRVATIARLTEAHDVSGLMFAVTSGSVEVARELLALGADPNAPLLLSYHTLAIVKGMTPLHLAATACASRNKEMIELLISAKADVHTNLAGLVTPLMAASYMNPDGVRALLTVDGMRIDQLGINSDTALGLAAFQGPTECVRELVAAKASVLHVKATGSTHLMSACDNPGVTEEMLHLLWADGAVDINARRLPRSAKWRAIFRLFEFFYRRGARGDLITVAAHSRGTADQPT